MGLMAAGALPGRAVDVLNQAAAVVASLAQGRGDDCIAIPSDTESGPSPYDRAIDGLNRLPRPCLAIGTLSLFVYAMVEPEGFARRMQGLSAVPEPLWWLFGAVVSFHFSAREAHYHRVKRPVSQDTAATGEVALEAPVIAFPVSPP